MRHVDFGDVAADGFIGAETVKSFSRGIPTADDAARREADDRVARRLDDRGKMSIAFLLFEHCPGTDDLTGCIANGMNAAGEVTSLQEAACGIEFDVEALGCRARTQR